VKLKTLSIACILFMTLIVCSQIFIPFGFWTNSSPIQLSPSSTTVVVNGTVQFTSQGGFSNRTYSLVSGAGSVNATTGLYTAPASPGNAVIRVTDSRGAFAEADIAVINSVSGLTVSQSMLSCGIGASFSVTAQAVYLPTGSADVTNVATWTSANSTIATVNKGIISCLGTGNVLITVSYGGFSQTVNVTVENKTLTSIAVNPSPHTMAVNAIRNFTATATYSDASTQDVTNSVTWSISHPSVASISNTSPFQGRATGLSAGSATINANLGSVSGTSTLTISNATLNSITITPSDFLGGINSNYQMTATGNYSDGSTSNITSLVTWSSSNSGVATISNLTATKGLLTTQNIASYQRITITATLGAISGTTPFGVNNSAINSIVVKPIVTMTAGSTYSMQAWGNTADGGSIDITSFATWSSATTSVATVSNSASNKGVVTGIANGTSVVTATYNGISGNRTVTVAGSSSMTDVGIGLNADYYNFTGGAPPGPAQSFLPANKKGARVDAKINFTWASGTAPMGVGDQFMVRWTGFYKAVSATNYFCTLSDDGVRLWINGTLYISNWTEHGSTWNCTGNVALTVGTKYTIVMEFYENGGYANAHLTRSSVSAADAQNETTRAVPQVDLYPY